MKVSELTGEELDYWVARAEGKKITRDQYGLIYAKKTFFSKEPTGWSPSRWWEQGGPIIDREVIQLVPVRPSGKTWHAIISHGIIEQENGMPNVSGVTVHRGKGHTALIAAMRAYVASKFGEEVPDQERA